MNILLCKQICVGCMVSEILRLSIFGYFPLIPNLVPNIVLNLVPNLVQNLVPNLLLRLRSISSIILVKAISLFYRKVAALLSISNTVLEIFGIDR